MDYHKTQIQKQIETTVTNARGYHDSPLYNPKDIKTTVCRLREKVYWDQYRPFKEDPLGIILRNFVLNTLSKKL